VLDDTEQKLGGLQGVDLRERADRRSADAGVLRFAVDARERVECVRETKLLERFRGLVDDDRVRVAERLAEGDERALVKESAERLDDRNANLLLASSKHRLEWREDRVELDQRELFGETNPCFDLNALGGGVDLDGERGEPREHCAATGDLAP